MTATINTWQADLPRSLKAAGWRIDHHATTCCNSRFKQHGRITTGDGKTWPVVCEKHSDGCTARPRDAIDAGATVFVRVTQGTCR